MSDGVLPCGELVPGTFSSLSSSQTLWIPIVLELVDDEIAYLTESQFPLWRIEYGHSDECNVRVGWLSCSRLGFVHRFAWREAGMRREYGEKRERIDGSVRLDTTSYCPL